MELAKKYIFRKSKLILLIIPLFFISLSSPLLAQDDEAEEAEPLETTMKLSAWQMSDGSVEFRILFSAEDTSANVFDVPEAIIDISLVGNDSTTIIAQTITNNSGKASLIIPSDNKFAIDTGGFVYFTASFEGNDLYGECEEEIGFKRLKINVETVEEDSLRTLYVTANYIDGNADEQPLHEAELIIYVKRLYSWLPIGDIYMEDGEGSFEFPTDISGNDKGNLIVAVKLEDSDDFASAEEQINVNWGVAVDYSIDENPRALWSNYAPTWMIVALIIVMLGVWFNFFLAIFKVFKMAKAKD